MTEDSSESVSRLCCQCLVQLVFDDHAEFDYILSGLLNAVPSSRWVKHPVRIISFACPLYTRWKFADGGCTQKVAKVKLQITIQFLKL